MILPPKQVGLCVKCQNPVVSQVADRLKTEKRKDLYKNNGCLMKAFDSNTQELKPEYRCDNSTEAYGYYKSFIAAF